MPFAAARMQLESIILSEVSQTEKGQYRMRSLTAQMDLSRNRLTAREQGCGSPGAAGTGDGVGLGLADADSQTQSG